MNEGSLSLEDIEEQMRNLRKQGLSLKEIASATGSNISKVQRVVKDVPMAIGLYRKELRAALVEGAIINLETTGLDSDTDDIITFGFLEHNIMTVVQRIEAESSDFYRIICEKLSHLAHPIYAYDARFHEAFLLAKLHVPVELVDISQPWQQRARTEGQRYPSLDELASVPRQYFGEIVDPDRQVRLLWASYLKTWDKRKFTPIVRNCMEDLRQALYVLTFIEDIGKGGL